MYDRRYDTTAVLCFLMRLCCCFLYLVQKDWLCTVTKEQPQLRCT